MLPPTFLLPLNKSSWQTLRVHACSILLLSPGFFKLISLNSRRHCCPESWSMKVYLSHSFDVGAQESLVCFEASFPSCVRSMCPMLPWKLWPKPSLEHVLFTRLFAFCSLNWWSTKLVTNATSFEGNLLFCFNCSPNNRHWAAKQLSYMHTQSIPSNCYSWLLILNKRLGEMLTGKQDTFLASVPACSFKP